MHRLQAAVPREVHPERRRPEDALHPGQHAEPAQQAKTTANALRAGQTSRCLEIQSDRHVGLLRQYRQNNLRRQGAGSHAGLHNEEDLHNGRPGRREEATERGRSRLQAGPAQVQGRPRDNVQRGHTAGHRGQHQVHRSHSQLSARHGDGLQAGEPQGGFPADHGSQRVPGLHERVHGAGEDRVVGQAEQEQAEEGEEGEEEAGGADQARQSHVPADDYQHTDGLRGLHVVFHVAHRARAHLSE